jgi:MFS transporter, UMF1 family
MQPTQLDNPKTIRAWAFFDWANSSYSLVIVVAIFPAWFLSSTPENLTFFGMPMTNSSLLAYSITVAYLVVALLMPALAGIADYGGRKKFFMRIFTMVGSAACVSMYFFTKGSVQLGFWSYVIATIGFAGGMVFNNAYLPEIASEKNLDSTSAKGFAYGYIGSVILLIINLLCITFWQEIGLPDKTVAIRLSFLSVGIWWFLFSQIPLAGLPADRPETLPTGDLVKKGWAELVGVFQELRLHSQLKRFLLAFFFYNAGVQTVLFLASAFADKELKFDTNQLILLILLLQLVAIGGAWIFSKISAKFGNKTSILWMLGVWAAICATAYFVISIPQFYALAVAVGLVMGGIQSLSRSTYSKMLPENTQKTASWFSFYDVVEKLSVIFGTLSFGILDQMTGSMRNSVLALGVFFVIAMVIFARVRVARL